jgi:hypothetical protein
MKLLDVKDMQFTHAMLADFMPWYSGWLDDGTGIPEPHSIMLSSLLTCIEVGTGPRNRKVYKN